MTRMVQHQRKTSKIIQDLIVRLLTHDHIRITGDIGLLEHADLVNSDGEDAMGQWFGELAVGRDGHQHFFSGPPITGRRRTGELKYCQNNLVSDIAPRECCT
jgi:hypothetical protein